MKEKSVHKYVSDSREWIPKKNRNERLRKPWTVVKILLGAKTEQQI